MDIERCVQMVGHCIQRLVKPVLDLEGRALGEFDGIGVLLIIASKFLVGTALAKTQ